MKLLFMTLNLLAAAVLSSGTMAQAASKAKTKSKEKVKASKPSLEKYTCDPKDELKNGTAQKQDHDSVEFKKVYTGLHSDFERSVSRICEYLEECEFGSSKKSDQEIRKNYSEMASGKQTLADLKRVREDFGYNAVDAYLFDGHALNTRGSSEVTHLIKNADRTYYLKEFEVLGFLDQTGEEGVFSRYGENCQISEVISFSNLSETQNSIRMILNKKYCKAAQNKGSTPHFNPQDLRSMGAFFAVYESVEHQLEAQELCATWIPKPEPLGLVIQSSDPENKKSQSKAKKKNKSRKKVAVP